MNLLMNDTDQANTLYDGALDKMSTDDARLNLQAMRHYAQGYAAARYEIIDGLEFSRPDMSLAFGYLYAAYKADGGKQYISALFDAWNLG